MAIWNCVIALESDHVVDEQRRAVNGQRFKFYGSRYGTEESLFFALISCSSELPAVLCNLHLGYHGSPPLLYNGIYWTRNTPLAKKAEFISPKNLDNS